MPLEQQIIEAIGDSELHGYAIATAMKEQQGGRNLAAHGTLYRALDRLVEMGFLTRRWEAPEEAEAGKRPPRRLYRRKQQPEQGDGG